MTRKTKRRAFAQGRGYAKRDWDEVSDNPRWTKAGVKKAKPFAEVFPALAEGIKRGRGRPRVEEPKEAITLRVLPSTRAKFQSSAGKNWRGVMAKVLDKAKV